MVLCYSPKHMRTQRLRSNILRRLSAGGCAMDSSKSALRSIIQLLHAKGKHASQIYRRMQVVYREQCLVRCTIFCWCQHYATKHVNIKDLPHPGQGHVVVNTAMISLHLMLIFWNMLVKFKQSIKNKRRGKLSKGIVLLLHTVGHMGPTRSSSSLKHFDGRYALLPWYVPM